MTLNERDIELLTRLRDGRSLRHADRVEDKSRQRMREIGYAKFDKITRRWSITDEGRIALMEGGK